MDYLVTTVILFKIPFSLSGSVKKKLLANCNPDHEYVCVLIYLQAELSQTLTSLTEKAREAKDFLVHLKEKVNQVQVWISIKRFLTSHRPKVGRYMHISAKSLLPTRIVPACCNPVNCIIFLMCTCTMSEVTIFPSLPKGITWEVLVAASYSSVLQPSRTTHYISAHYIEKYASSTSCCMSVSEILHVYTYAMNCPNPLSLAYNSMD